MKSVYNKVRPASSLVPRPSSLASRPSSLVPRPSSLVLRPSSLVPRVSSLVPRPSSLTMSVPKSLLYLIVGCVIILISACDKVDAPYREFSQQGVSFANGTAVIITGDTFYFPSDTSAPVKKVLAEDYTGMLCGNCPNVGLKLNDTLKQQYGDRLVVISVHAGTYADPCPNGLLCPGTIPGSFLTDFRCFIGNEWDGFFGNSAAGNPNGLIDRIDYPTLLQVKSPSVWSTLIQQRSLLPSPFAIRISNKYNSTTRELKTAVQTRVYGNFTGNYKLSVVIVEDSIMDWQNWIGHNPQYFPSYEHRNVLRIGLNSSFGEVIGNIANDSLMVRGYSNVLDTNWNAAHCHAISFVYDADSYEVKEAEEVSIH